MKNTLFFLFLSLFFVYSCNYYQGEKVDLVVHNGKIHLMNDKLETAEAMAIHNGKIVEIGPERQIVNRYAGKKIIDAKSKDIFPGFHDAHGHIFSLAEQMLNCDLRESHSYYEVIGRLEKHHAKMKQKVIVGRGWDQSLWNEKELPTNDLLNENFPSTPVAITRIDGHAMLINQAMMDFVGITDTTTIEGGEFIKKNDTLTGLLLDHALDVVNEKIPAHKTELIKENILAIQENLLGLGLTHIHEAGITAEQRDILIKMADENLLKINIYAMLFPSEENISFAQQEGHYKNGKLSIRSFKLIADGALGSRGACLIHPYSDDTEEYGMLLKSVEKIKSIAKTAKQVDYQLNTHCIGDSANRLVLNIIDTLMKDENNHRWRIEHAQIIHPSDFDLFTSSGALPSVQPTHATTDYRWAESRLGVNRLEKEGYRYKTLQEKAGMMLFGTDFPIENYDPFATLFAATERKNTENEPSKGFLKEEAVSTDIALKAMTLWASFGCFEEGKVGTLERGKNANFTILDHPFHNRGKFQTNYAWKTFVEGQIVFDME